jgi:hypothetical protein
MFVAGLYTALVAKQFWDWFVTAALHLSEIPFWTMYGLVMFIGLFSSYGESPVEELRWKGLMIAVQACVPPHRVEEVNEERKIEADGLWPSILSTTFGRLFGNTLALFLGWVVHTFLA